MCFFCQGFRSCDACGVATEAMLYLCPAIWIKLSNLCGTWSPEGLRLAKAAPFKSTHVSLVFVEFLPIVQSPENEATRWWRFCSESCYDQSLPQQRALLDIQSCGIRTGKSIASHVHRGLPPFGIARHELPEWSTWEADDAQQKVRCNEFWKGQSGRTICTAWFSNFCVVLDREGQSCLLMYDNASLVSVSLFKYN